MADLVLPLQRIASQVPIANQGNFLDAVACLGRIYIGNTCESSVTDIEQLVESLIARKEEIEHV